MKVPTKRETTDSCIFCALRESRNVVMRNELAFALYDTTPVTPFHALVLPYRHAQTYFDLIDTELAAANDLLRRMRSHILEADPSVQGFNVGANIGRVSGQSIFHCHIHLIPRRKGDIENPLGGVRAVIPGKMRY